MMRGLATVFYQVFVNLDAEKLYNHFLRSAQSTHVECDFASEPSDGNLLDQLVRLGWQRLCNQSCAANVVVVWELHNNAHFNRPGNVVLVRSKDVSFSSATLRHILNVPTIVNDDFHLLLHEGADYEALLQEMGFPSSHWSYSVSNPTKPLHIRANTLNCFGHAWYHFICHNFLPNSQRSKITTDRALLTYCICSGRSIDAATIIKDSICHRANLGQHPAALTHPILITYLCAQACVPMSDEEMTLGPKKFNHDSLMRTEQWPGSIPEKDGMGFVPFPNQPPPLPPPAAPP